MSGSKYKLVRGIKAFALFFWLLREQCSLWIPGYISGAVWIVREFLKLKAGNNPAFTLSWLDLMPFVRDRTQYTPLDAVYFFQDTWAAGKIFASKPSQHVDIGSSAKTVGILSQFVPTTMIDIRPLALLLSGLNFIEGSILDIPAKDRSIESLSSLCVVEHIGLGRYGDPLDAFGSEKAAKELQRVLSVGGNLYFSVPIDATCKIYFNAHRAFTRDYVLALFSELALVEEKYQYGNELCSAYDAQKGFGTGLFHFRRLA